MSLAAAIVVWLMWLAANVQAQTQTQPQQRGFVFGPFERAITNLGLPSAAAIAGDGTIVVADAGDHLVRVIGRDGSLLRTFGSLGERAGQLHSPSGIAIGDDGLVHVADTGNDRVQVFSIAGEFVRGWGSRGTASGEFCQPRGIAVAGERIYVADTGNQRVQVFRSDGTFIRTLGEAADQSVKFRRPVDVAVDGQGRVFVVDADANRISIFDAEGVLIRSFGDYGPFAGLLNNPQGLTCIADQILLADTANHRFQFFDEHGETRRQWGVHDPASHEGNGRIHYPHDVAIAPDGSFAVICEPLEHRVQIFRAWRPSDPQEPRQANLGGDQTHFGSRLAIDGRLLVIPEPENQFLYLLDLQQEVPVLISQTGQRGEKFGQFIRPTGVSVSEQSRTMIVADATLARLQLFAIDFKPEAALDFDPFMTRLVQSIDCQHPRFARPIDGMRWPLNPETLRRDAQGNLHVLDQRNAIVVVFDATMQFVRAYGGIESGLRQPTDLAFSPDGSIAYVVDAGHFCVLAFDATGKVIRSFGEFGDGEAQFRQPFGIAVDGDGDIYVSDGLRDDIQKFDAAGSFVAKWGGRGLDHGKLWRPQGLAIDDRQRLIVIDHGNHRAQMFSLAGEWMGTFGAGRATLKSQLPD